MHTESMNKALQILYREPTYTNYLKMSNLLDRESSFSKETPALKVAILRNITIEMLLPVLKAEIALLGFKPVFYVGDFDSIAHDAMDTNSPLYAFEPDVVLICQWLPSLSTDLHFRYSSLSEQEKADRIKQVTEHHISIFSAIRKNTSVPILFNNFPFSGESYYGIADSQAVDSHLKTTIEINQEVLKITKLFYDVYVVDFFKLFALAGSTQCFDQRYWHISRAPLTRHALLAIGLEYAKYIRALTGKTKKCLVLDCDNTIWGGVIGEMGTHGIQIGTEYPGNCYQSFQQAVLNLYDRGVLLAICSKNNESDVLDVFKNNPDMLLREHHFVAWQVNWKDKPSNLMKIARDLNISLDSIVFVDDDSFECGSVRSSLPEVQVIELSGDPSSYYSKISERGFFDSLSFSKEDSQRSKMYKDNEKRKHLLEVSENIDDYLSKLDIGAIIEIADATKIPRISQLTQKTNQFNLTSKRYTEGQIQMYVESVTHDVVYMSLSDSIADLGIIGVSIVEYREGVAMIDTFLLSCRALGRKAEDALLDYVLNMARDKGCHHALGFYLPTPKNIQVADFYELRGFLKEKGEHNGSAWKRDLTSPVTLKPSWIKIKQRKSEESQ